MLYIHFVLIQQMEKINYFMFASLINIMKNIHMKIFGIYYIQKAFVIISQYYYFTLYKYLCEYLYNLIYEKRDNQNPLPLEIVIYNIVNFIQSPINYELHLNIFDNSYDEGAVQLWILSGYPYLQFDLDEIFDLLTLNMILEIYIFSVLEQSILFFSSNLEILNIVMFII